MTELENNNTGNNTENQENHYISISIDGQDRKPVWRIGRLWLLASQLPVTHIPIETLSEYLDEIPLHWFHQNNPSVRDIATRMRRILAANLSYPIILSAEGVLLDGQHRLAKAWMLGYTTIATVRFIVNPEPDEWKERQKQ